VFRQERDLSASVRPDSVKNRKELKNALLLIFHNPPVGMVHFAGALNKISKPILPFHGANC
ncbi:MAG: hypothetical protein Q8K69_09450, partial [Bacteroidota bacterium]|nr:hypothetical protein [Bacteroidota bacterium]